MTVNHALSYKYLFCCHLKLLLDSFLLFHFSFMYFLLLNRSCASWWERKISDSSLNPLQDHTHEVGGQKILTEMFGKVCVKICMALSLLFFAWIWWRSLFFQILSSDKACCNCDSKHIPPLMQKTAKLGHPWDLKITLIQKVWSYLFSLLFTTHINSFHIASILNSPPGRPLTIELSCCDNTIGLETRMQSN